jgi:uncharacterized membrane protein
MTMASKGRSGTIALFSVFCTGQLAGMMLAIGVAQAAAQHLPEESWTLRQQADDGVFSKLMPVIFLLNILALGASFSASRKRSRVCFGAAGAFLIGTIVDTIVLNVPINVKISTWKAGSAPADWTTERDKWLEAHWIRTATGSVSFLCAGLGCIVS